MNTRAAHLFAVLLYALLVMAAPAAAAASFDELPGVRIDLPDNWVVAERMTDAVELAHVNQEGTVEARLVIRLERRNDPQDAFERAAQIIGRFIESAEFFVSAGWPAAIQRISMPLPQRQVGPPQLPAVRYTTVVLVGAELYIATGWVLSSARESVHAGAEGALRSSTFQSVGDAVVSAKVLRDLQDRARENAGAAPAPPTPKRNRSATPPPDRAIQPANVTSTVAANWGELSVAVSHFGQNIVVQTQRGAVSSQAGSPFAPSTFSGPGLPILGDPSAAWAGSRSFYLAAIQVAANVGCSLQIARSDDQGRTFNWNGSSPQFCADPAPAAAVCFPDQEHIAAEDTLGLTPTNDRLYAVWRHMTGIVSASCIANPVTNPVSGLVQSSLTCTSDGGATWAPRVPIGVSSDDPRVAVDADGSVWVAFREGNDIMIDHFLACSPSGMTRVGFPKSKFPKKIATASPIRCSIVGLDRCGSYLHAPTVASDGFRIAVTYGSSDSSNNDTIAATESYDWGKTWSSPIAINDTGTNARRFMPWSCNSGNGPDSRIFVGWYDRRAAAAAGAAQDLTDYYLTSLGRGVSAPTGQVDFDSRVSVASDAQCTPPWTMAPRAGANDLCAPLPAPLTGTCSNTFGICTPTTPLGAGCTCINGRINCNCPIQFNQPVAPACGACTGNGIPRYGDYNGLGCGDSLIAAAWASGLNAAGVANPGNAVQVVATTVGLGLRKPLGTPYSGNFIQRFESPSSIKEFDLIVSSGPPVSWVRHLARANDAPGFPWIEQPSLLSILDDAGRDERPLGVSLIQSRYPSGARPRSGLEAVIRMQERPRAGTGPRIRRPQYLAHYSRLGASMAFIDNGAVIVDGRRVTGITGDPALIQSTRGDNGNFEMLVPQGDQLVHYLRDNDLPGTPWSRVGVVMTGTGGVEPIDVALIQSNIRGAGTNAGDLEAVVRLRRPRRPDILAQYSFDSSTNAWRSVGVVEVRGIEIPVTGAPALIQSSYGNGRFELLVPAGRDVVHYTNDRRSNQWRKVASLYPPPQAGTGGGSVAVPSDSIAVAMFQSTFGSPGNLEAVVYKRNSVTRQTHIDAWFMVPPDVNWRRIGPVTAGGGLVSRIDGF